jgi:hypothetical protein
MKNKKRFAEMMSSLAVLFDKDVSEVLRGIYWQVLKGYSDEEVELAFHQVVASCKFFPKPAEIIQFIKSRKAEENQANALESWGMVMSGLECGVIPEDRRIRESIRRIGGWDWLSGQSYDELHWLEKRFLEHFDQIAESETYDNQIAAGEERKLLEGLSSKVGQ